MIVHENLGVLADARSNAWRGNSTAPLSVDPAQEARQLVAQQEQAQAEAETEASSGFPTWGYVGIGAGVLGVLGFVTYLFARKKG